MLFMGIIFPFQFREFIFLVLIMGIFFYHK